MQLMNTNAIPALSSKEWSQQFFSRSMEERFPWSCQWELTCRCNLKCVMCYTDCFNKPEKIRQELNTQEIFQILGELQEAGCMELAFTGGEPMSRPDFMQIYDETHRLGFLITIFTNGTLITSKIADHWAEARPKSVEISLHGFSQQTFEEVTQIPGSLKRCLSAIELLVHRKIPIVLKTVGLASINLHEILAIKRYAESLEGDVQWKFGQYMRDDLERSGAPFRWQLSEKELVELEKQDPELWKAKCEETVKFESIQPMCGGGGKKFHIDAYGQLQLCSNNRRASYDLRKGSFREGFYEVLPNFPCPRKKTESQLIQLEA